MNKIPGTIQEVQSENHLSLVRILACGDMFTSIVIDTPATAPYLALGSAISLLFKENEVVIAKSFEGKISMQNRFVSTIKNIEKGKLLCKVVMDYKEHTIVSIITVKAAEQLQLVVGDSITALVKTNEISLSPHD